MTSSAPLMDALRSAAPGVPGALVEFDRIAGAPGPEPDFLEWSAHVGRGCEASRLTYYFDAGRHGGAGVRAAGERFEALAAAFSVALPVALPGVFAEEVPRRGEVQQVVLGIDERPAGRRVKLYLVLQGAAPELVDRLLVAVGASRGGDLDAAKVYILGLDFGAGGLSDAKLYFRLDRGRLGRSVANLGEIRELFAATREVVLQRCLVSDRSQLYLHADNPVAIGRYLRGRADGGAVELCARHEAVVRGLSRGRLEPWIISFAYRQHRLHLGEGNVYYHLHGAEAPPGARKISAEAGGGHPPRRPLSWRARE